MIFRTDGWSLARPVHSPGQSAHGIWTHDRGCDRDGSSRQWRLGAPSAHSLIDRLVRHTKVISLKGEGYRLKDRDLGRIPAQATGE